MQEEIIAFETAKLAKEVGFQNKTPHKLRRNYYNYLGELNGDCTAYIKRFANEEDTSDFVNVEAPTQSLLQRWLRDEHDINVVVRHSYKTLDKYIVSYSKWRDDKKFRTTYFIIPLDDDGIPNGTHQDFTTYEGALERGLQEALKLIKKQ